MANNDWWFTGAWVILLLLMQSCKSFANNATPQSAKSSEKSDEQLVRVNKCCEKFEIYNDSECTQVNEIGK